MMDLYCTQCHRECHELEDPTSEEGVLSHCHSAPTLSGNDRWIIMAIRGLWAADSAIIADVKEVDYDYPFGVGSYDDPEIPNVDLHLIQTFKEERQHHADDLTTIWVLIRG